MSARLQSKVGPNAPGNEFLKSTTQHADAHNVKFMKTDDGYALVEAVLSLWDINEKGQIMKKKEISFDYDMNFKPSMGGS